jgi:hypothetical protein
MTRGLDGVVDQLSDLRLELEALAGLLVLEVQHLEGELPDNGATRLHFISNQILPRTVRLRDIQGQIEDAANASERRAK